MRVEDWKIKAGFVAETKLPKNHLTLQVFMAARNLMQAITFWQASHEIKMNSWPRAGSYFI